MKDGVFNPLWMKWSRSIYWDAKIELPKIQSVGLSISINLIQLLYYGP